MLYLTDYSPDGDGGSAPDGGDTPEQGDGKTFDAGYVSELRSENAKWRTELRDAQAQLKELQPLAQKYQQQQEAQKSEAEKMADKLAEMQAELQSAQQQAQREAKARQLTTLAAKAGVSPDVIPMLNVDAFDLEDEEAALKRLGSLATPKSAGGGASNPSRNGQAESDEERRARLFGGAGQKNIFSFGGS